MSVYGFLENDEPKFLQFDLCVYINLARIATITTVPIESNTKMLNLFEKIAEFLKRYNIKLTNREDHHFVYINGNGEEELLYHTDWNVLVKDLDFFSMKSMDDPDSSLPYEVIESLFRTMKLEQTVGALDPNRYKLERIIGVKEDFISKGIDKLELSSFQESIKKMYRSIAVDYSKMTREAKLLVEHPVAFSRNSKLYKGEITIQVGLDSSKPGRSLKNCNKFYKSLKVSTHSTVDVIVNEAIKKFQDRGDEFEKSEYYYLKIADREEYLVSLEPTEFIRFKYIENCYKTSKKPELVLVHVNQVNILGSKPGNGTTNTVGTADVEGNENEFQESWLKSEEYIYVHYLWRYLGDGYSSRNRSSVISTNSNADDRSNDSVKAREYIMKAKFDRAAMVYTIKVTDISCPSTISVGKDYKIVIRAGLYHGRKSLCENQYKDWCEDQFADIYFPIEIWNIPRMARLSFALILVRQSVKDVANAPQKKIIGWGNIMVYDHHAVLKSGEISYRMWGTIKRDLNPIGSVYSSPDGEMIAPLMKINLVPLLSTFKTIVYPQNEVLISESGKMLHDEHLRVPCETDKVRLAEIISRSPLDDDVMEDEKDFLWKYRYYIRDYYPDALPRLLIAKTWNNFETVAQMQHLVCGWPMEGDIVLALELLGPDYPDSDIRMKAVQSLAKIPWDDLALYLLQISQCLKYESYLNSNLIRFLLKRMFENAKIAQSMFYYMKVEMSTCVSTRVTFSIILYHFLQYSRNISPFLIKQYLAMIEFCNHNKALMQYAVLEGERKASFLKKFQDALSSNNSVNTLNDLICPLDPNIKLKTLIPERCKFMDSKMRPLRLTWSVNETFERQFVMIYKNGDDLRQDALIVQMFHIMDSIWRNAGLDLKLDPYEVLACSKNEGFIEVVQKAETLANIHRYSAKVDNYLLINWLKEKKDNDLSIVVQNFKRSCAAYCIATFVLGIGDRHSDNIMLTIDGHLFHIDFGHILGNFKRICGIPRELTKFILVQSFLHVIAEEAKGKEDWQKAFKDLCCKGYIALRKHSNLILSLFNMMLNADLPEISSMEDLNYLKETLQIGKTDEEAQAYFLNVYDDTLRKETFVSLNWFSHIIRRKND